MMIYFCLLFPSFISIYINTRRCESDIKQELFKYPLYTLLINMLSLSVVYIYARGNEVFLEYNFGTLGFCLKYLLISTINAYILPYLIEYYRKNIKIELHYIKKGKNNEKKSS